VEAISQNEIHLTSRKTTQTVLQATGCYVHKIRRLATQTAVNMLNKSVKKKTCENSRHKTIGGKNIKGGTVTDCGVCS
jgi:hypothetical protein